MKISLTVLKPALASAKGRWQALSVKERKQLLIMVALVGFVGAWLTLTKPALDSLTYWEDELPRIRTQAKTLQLILADVEPPDIAGSTSRTQIQQLRLSLDYAGFAGTYLISQREGNLQVDFQQPADAEQLLAWLFTAKSYPGMAIQQLNLQRLDNKDAVDNASGLICAQVTMELVQTGKGL